MPKLLLLLLTTHAAAQLPLYDILPQSTSWPKCQPSGGSCLYMGDIRASVAVPQSAVGQPSEVQIWWRRRDEHPELKAAVLVDPTGEPVTQSSAAVIESSCGVLSFTPRSAGMHFVYYLPYWQSGGGAALHFHWYNCTEHSRSCVLSSQSSVCSEPLSGGLQVTGLEYRVAASPPTDFFALSPMELVADPSELQGFIQRGGAVGRPFVFMEHKQSSVKMFKQVPALWAREPAERRNLTLAAAPGEYATFQIGLWAAQAGTGKIDLSFSKLVGPDSSIDASALSCLNLRGVDPAGVPFAKNYSLEAGAVGSMWVGVTVPSDASGEYAGEISLSCSGCSDEAALQLTLQVSGAAVQDAGAEDIYSMSRLSWLDSSIGIDEEVTAPFTAVEALPEEGTGLRFGLVNKVVTVGASGLPSKIDVLHTKNRQGQNLTVSYPVLGSPVSIQVLDSSGSQIPLQVSSAAATSSLTPSTAKWHATLRGAAPGGATVTVDVCGELDYDSYIEMSLNVSSDTPVAVSDVRLSVAHPASPVGIVGFGVSGGAYQDLSWKWNNATGNPFVWMGRVEAGLFLKLKGAGTAWNSPMFGGDYPVIPFIPTSWGGAQAANQRYGANVTAGVVTTFSGPRTLQPTGEAFLFDLAASPSKPLNMKVHWSQRYLQVGYGTPYYSPQEVHAMNVTVVTLHQGIPGLVNGTLVNPYINYPFVPDTVGLLENYTQQAHALGMAVKFYYTIRELSNRAAELPALRALQGEVYLDEDPYTIAQAGYCHDWDCHGGDAWLHQHVVNDYVYCWQQSLADGSWDAAICDRGTGRWFNYYAKGVDWSVRNAPHIDGIYYDGINFDRRSMRRIRKILDRASEGKAHRPLVDFHTGEVGASSPSPGSYLSHFPYADSAWNGEGFDFGAGPYYWLVEVSGLQHGISVDRLGGNSVDTDFKGMLFGATQRNYATSPAWWALWDSVQIAESTMVGWWEQDSPLALVVTQGNCSSSPSSSNAVLGTVFVSYGSHALVVVGSWADQACTVHVQLNATALGVAPPLVLRAPSIAGVQNASDLTSKIQLPANGGIVFTVQKG